MYDAKGPRCVQAILLPVLVEQSGRHLTSHITLYPDIGGVMEVVGGGRKCPEKENRSNILSLLCTHCLLQVSYSLWNPLARCHSRSAHSRASYFCITTFLLSYPHCIEWHMEIYHENKPLLLRLSDHPATMLKRKSRESENKSSESWTNSEEEIS